LPKFHQTQSQSKISDDRRQYYRVVDQASVTIAPLINEEPLENHFPYGSQLQLLGEMTLADAESRHLLGQISERDRALGAYLKIQNKKIETLSQLLTQATIAIDPHSVINIDLSEGGAAFIWPAHLVKDMPVAVQLILLPDYTGLLLKARVKSCDQSDNPNTSTPSFNLRIAFDDTTEAQRHLIARHVMRKQSRERQKRLNSP